MSEEGVTWNQIAARGQHIMVTDAYVVLYGAPPYADDPEAWYAWRDEMNRNGYVKHPDEKLWHTDDCPGCWAEQWKDDE